MQAHHPREKRFPWPLLKLFRYLIYFEYNPLWVSLLTCWPLASNSTFCLHAGLTSTNSLGNQTHENAQNPKYLHSVYQEPTAHLPLQLLHPFTCDSLAPFILTLSYSNCSLFGKSGKPNLAASSLFWPFSITIWFCNSHLSLYFNNYSFCWYFVWYTLNKIHPCLPKPTSSFPFSVCAFSHGPPTLAHLRTSELYRSSHLGVSDRTNSFH